MNDEPSLQKDLAVIAADESEPADAPPARIAGRFVKGESGNPAGRAKGSRNKITIQRLELEAALRGDLGKVGRKVLKKAIELALDGNEQMIKLLLDKTLSTLRNEDVGETRDTEIRVEINNLTAVQSRDPRDGSIEVQAKILPSNPTEPS